MSAFYSQNCNIHYVHHELCVLCIDLTASLPNMAYSRAPSLGLVLFLLKNSAADFFRFHQSHRQSLGKLQSLDQLPPEELKEVMTDKRLTRSNADTPHLSITTVCSCAKAWCPVREVWRKSRRSKEVCWPTKDWCNSSTIEPSCWPSAPVSFYVDLMLRALI